MFAQSTTVAPRPTPRPSFLRIFTASWMSVPTTGGTLTSRAGGAGDTVEAMAGVATKSRAAPKVAARSFFMTASVGADTETALTRPGAALTRTARPPSHH